MDKMSRNVLNFIQTNEPVSRGELTAQFGDAAVGTVDYLLSIEYISSDSARHRPYDKPAFDENEGPYRLRPPGRAYLAEYKGATYDRFSARVLPVIAILISLVSLYINWLSLSAKC